MPSYSLLKTLIEVRRLQRLGIYLACCLSLIMLYISASRLWVDIGGGSFSIRHFEIPLLTVLLGLLYFDKFPHRILHGLLSLLSILLLYLGFDLFYRHFARAPRPSDFQNIMALFAVSKLLGLQVLLGLCCLPMPVLILVFKARRYYSTAQWRQLLLGKLALLLVLLGVLCSDVFLRFEQQHAIYVEWSQERTIRKNGRFTSFLYFYGREQQNAQTLQSYRTRSLDIGQILFAHPPVKTPNIHLILLESFIDPRLLTDVQFTPSPLAPNLQDLMAGHDFSHVISPSYGGETAQAEFELLSGIKAYAKIDSIEFNVMRGAPINAFVQQLKNNGYQVLSSIATGPDYYNSNQAYTSLGLNSPTYLENSGILSAGDVRIFDGDLFEYNLAKIKPLLANDHQPLFNYVLGIYGHMPYDRNLALRPDRINVMPRDEKLQRISNQFFYRTQALADYIQALQKLDPNGIIYISSDHLPPILNQTRQYRLDKHANISLLWHGSQWVSVSGKHYYEIPWLIWSLLSEKPIPQLDEPTLQAVYYKALSESL